MRKVKWFLLVCCLSVFFTGCQNEKEKEKEKEEVLQVSHEDFSYIGTEHADAITVDENGMLYTIRSEMPEFEPTVDSEAVIPQAMHELCMYDLNGECVKKVNFELGNSSIQDLVIEDNVLYFILGCENQLKLVSVDMRTEQVKELFVLTGYEKISELAWAGDYLYMIGKYKNVENKDYELHPDVMHYIYSNEKIGRINPLADEIKLEVMNVDFPISIFETGKDTLVIYRYTEENGFGFLEFDAQAGALSEAGWKNTATPINIVSGCENGYVFVRGEHLYHGLYDGTDAQISPEKFSIRRTGDYVKGFLFCLDEGVKRICVTDIMQENAAIRVLMSDNTQNLPYGCGFRMERNSLSGEEFSLKVLALDTDYDLYGLSTREYCAYNLYKNGVFYSLNKVDGVEEYLDACFPYIKELAYNEDGDIWMIPVELAVPTILYNRNLCAENQVDISDMDYMKFLSFTEEIEKIQPEKTSISFLVVVEELFAQYLSENDNFDTEVFRQYAEKLHDIYQSQGSWSFDFFMGREIRAGRIPEAYYEYNIYNDTLYDYAENLKESDIIGAMGVPKLSEQVSNIGTLTFIAVNPESENLEATLDYISAYAKYMLAKKDSLLLADKDMYTDTSFMEECYQVYANGSVRFAIDTEVYLETFIDYLFGELDLESAIAEMERRRKLYMEE